MKVNYIYLDITNKCNMHCAYCYKNRENGSTDILEDTLENALKWGKMHGARSITLGGGEPSLNENLDCIVKKIKSCDYDKIRIMTNGNIFFDKNSLKNMHMVDEICFSLDSYDSDSARLGFDSSVFGKIKEFQEKHKSIDFTIKSTITKHNIYEFEKIIKFAIENKFKTITFGYCLPTGEFSNVDFQNDIMAMPNEMFCAEKSILELKHKYHSQITIIEPCVVYGCKFTTSGTEEYDLHIDEKGNIYPCDGLSASEYIIGNVNEIDADEAFYVGMKKIIHIINQKNQKCKGCGISKYCSGTCLLYGISEKKNDADRFCPYKRIRIVQKNMERDVNDKQNSNRNS